MGSNGGGFCGGDGLVMSSRGLRWSGLLFGSSASSEQDCALLWMQPLVLSSWRRVALANGLVFLLAFAAQLLHLAHTKRLARAKEQVDRLTKRKPLVDTAGIQLVASSCAEVASSSSPVASSPTVAAPPTLSTTNRSQCARKRQVSKKADHHRHHHHHHIHAEEVKDQHSPCTKHEHTIAMEAAALHEEADQPKSTKTTGTCGGGPKSFEIQQVTAWQHLSDSLLHGGRMALAYLLMLAVMTYELSLIGSIVLGFVAGFCVSARDTCNVPVSADPCCA